MKPETDFEAELAKTLGYGKEKTSAISQLSIEELAEFVRSSADAIKQAARVEVAKSKTASISLEMADKWGRELAQKTASVAESAGGLVQKALKHPASSKMIAGGMAGAAADRLTNKDPSLGSTVGAAGLGVLGAEHLPRAAKALAGHDSEIGRNFAKGLKGAK